MNSPSPSDPVLSIEELEDRLQVIEIDTPPLWLPVLVAGVLPLVLLGLFYLLRYPGLTHGDALDFAQLGRNLLSGRGFVTFILRPLALSHGDDVFHQPELTHGPLYPILLALSMGALGVRDGAVLLVSACFYLLSIPVVYVLGARLFHWRVGLVTAAIVATNAQLLEYAVSGLHITLLVSLMLLLLLVMQWLESQAAAHRPGDSYREPARELALAGALAGSLYLTEPVMFWVIPVVLWFGMRQRPQEWLGRLFWLALPLVVLVAPWMWRNHQFTGNAVFGLRGQELWMSGAHSSPLGYRLLPGSLQSGLAVLPSIFRKLGMSLDRILRSLPSLSGVWLLGAVIPTLLLPLRASATRFRAFTFALLGAVLGGMLPLDVNVLLLAAFVPILSLFAVSYLEYLFSKSTLAPASTRGVAVAVLFALAYPVIGMLAFQPRPPAATEGTTASALRNTLGEQSAVISDQPWLVAWHSDCPALWIPTSEGSMTTLRQRFPQARWLMLTPQSRVFSPEWDTLYQVFLKWNQDYEAKRAAEQPLPERIGIRKTSKPLFRELEGLTAVPLTGSSAQRVVLAAFPAPKPPK
jgi:4-amino-4-deoxy-L-arabinose transferase-like glycosyltransferase